MADAPSLSSRLETLAHGNTKARAAAARAMSDTTEDRAVRALLAALQSDPSSQVRLAAARSLGTARPGFSSQRGLLLDEMVRSLLALLPGDDIQLALAACAAVGAIGREQAVPDLLAALAADQLEDVVRRAAADALMRLDGKRAVGAVLTGLRHSQAVVRGFTAVAMARYVMEYNLSSPWRWLGWFQPEKNTIRTVVNGETLVLLAALTEIGERDRDPGVRQAARAALAAIGDTLEAIRLYGVIEEREDDDYIAVPTGKPEHDRPTAAEEKVTHALRAAELAEDTLPAAQQGGEPGLLARALGGLRLIMGRLDTVARLSPRYADLTFFEKQGSRALPEGHALRSGEWYRLEVAVRAAVAGIPPKGPRRPLREPRQREDVELHVTLEGDGFDIEEPVDILVLPPSGDSTRQASFLVRPTVETTSAMHPAELRARIYYRFNLLEEVVVEAVVVGRFDDPAHPEGAPKRPISFRQQRLDRAYIDLDDVRPRAMHIHVDRRENRFVFEFTLADPEQRKVYLAACAPIELTDLEDMLVHIRRLWCKIAISETFATALEAGEDEFISMVRQLAAAGRGLWVKLFKLESGGAMSKIEKWLAESPLAPGSILQVSLGHGASAFAFPWALLYDRPLPVAEYALPDPEGFWGMRYAIEQQPPALKGTDEPAEEKGAICLDVMQWSYFRNIDRQDVLMKDLERRSQGRLTVGLPPVSDARTCFRRLRDNHAHILYFYAHGYTRRREAYAAPGPERELLARWWESLPPGSSARIAFEEFYRRLREGWNEPDRSWIELTHGRLYLDELYEQVSALALSPIVVLNLCESAQISPMLSDSFVHFFLDRGAQVVIGTECPMNIEFADSFSRQFLYDVLTGEPVGAALLAARRHFMARRNPLALAYTLYGQATAAFDPPPISALSQEGDSDAELRRAGVAGG